MNRIKQTRQAKSQTQEQLAHAVGVTRQTISLYEAESREPKGTTWQKLSDVLGVSVPYLQGISDKPSDNPTQADFERWDNQLAEEQAKQAKNIFECIQPDVLKSMDLEARDTLLSVLNQSLTYTQSHPTYSLDLVTLLTYLNGNGDKSPNISDDFKKQVLDALS